MLIAVAFSFMCLLFGVGCPDSGSTERVQIRNQADVQMSEIRNNADIAQTQARMNAQVEEAYAAAEAQIGVAQAEAVAQTGVAQAAASADIAWATAAQAVGVAEADARVQINQAWAIALVVFALAMVGVWSAILSQMRPSTPSWASLGEAQRQALNPATWRALEAEAASRGQRLELQGNTMLLVDGRTNAIVAQREV